MKAAGEPARRVKRMACDDLLDHQEQSNPHATSQDIWTSKTKDSLKQRRDYTQKGAQPA